MNDLDRMKREYDQREIRLAQKNLYSYFNPANLFTLQQRQRMLLKCLKKNGYDKLGQYHILEMGCGNGGVLVEFLGYGALPEHLFGVDLLIDRVTHAHNRLPSSGFSCGDGQQLPFSNDTFDIVMQFTALSSILDANIRYQVALDMLRVLKRDGIIVWYDFWTNPTNKQTHGITPEEIRHLFPDCACEFNKTTLAPPLERIVLPFSWPLTNILESFRLFNSHYLVIIHKKK